jgi:hypothetical protein
MLDKVNAITEMSLKRVISMDKVRSICIANEYYTCGDTRDYSRMLNMVSDGEFTDSVLETVAMDIYNHSDVERFTGIYGCSEIDFLESIVFNLVNGATTTVVLASADFE